MKSIVTKLAKVQAGRPRPVVLTGDFNTVLFGEGADEHVNTGALGVRATRAAARLAARLASAAGRTARPASRGTAGRLRRAKSKPRIRSRLGLGNSATRCFRPRAGTT